MEKRISHNAGNYPTPSAERAARTLASLEQTGIGTWEYNLLSEEININENWANILGYTREELPSLSITTWQQKVHPEDLKNSRKEKQRYLTGSISYHKCTVRMQHKQGHWVWIETRGAIASYTPDGRPEWIYGTHRDISEQINLKSQVQETENNFRAFFNTSPDYMWVIDRNGTILDVNKTVLENLRYTREEMVGESILMVHEGEERITAERILKELPEKQTIEFRLPIHTKNKNEIPVETRISIAAWNGEPAVFGISRDISMLEASEEKYSKLFETSPAMIGLVDVEKQTWTDINPAFTKILGFTRQDMIGRELGSALKIPAHIMQEAMKQVFATGHLDNYEVKAHTKNGDCIDALLSCELLEIQNTTIIYATAIQITDQKKTERKLQRALDEEKLLLEELNHRVKNNLMMVGSLISLKNAELGETADLSDLLARVQAITSLHQQLQDSRSVISIPLGPYIRQVIFSAVHNFNRRIGINFNFPDLNIDTRRAVTLGLIVNELATNAAKHGFAEIEDPKIHIEISQQDKNYLLVFSNNGSPIDDHIDFERGDTLGLRLISTLIQQIEGKFSVERNPHPVFTLSIPVDSK